MKAFTRDAGTGIRPWGVFQSIKQMRALAPDGDTILPASAALQTWFGIRDEGTASHLSRMIGTETLRYADKHAIAHAQNTRMSMVQTIMDGGNPFKAALEYSEKNRLAAIPKTVSRPLRTTSEILGMPEDKMVLYGDGLSHPVYADRKAYYEQPQMAGRYHPNPFFPPETHVQIMTHRGKQWRPVIHEPVPREYAHYPQYQNGKWSRIG